MDKEIQDLQKAVEAKQKQELALFEDKPKQEVAVVDNKDALVDNMFEQAIQHQVKNNEDLKNQVLGTAKIYTETKMQTISTKVDTEHKEAIFNNQKDACESYGFNEKTTPIWAVKFMAVGYSVMLAIWLFIGSFTFMPVIFVAKKLSVGIKKTWISGVIALLLYLAITLVPILIGVIRH